MKVYNKAIAFLFLFILISTKASFGQTYGEIFTNTEANQKFGPVTSSITITSTQLQDFLNKTNNVLMFKAKDGNLIVLGDGRRPIYPSSAAAAATDVFKAYSKSVISELLNKGGSGSVNIEMRSGTLTITDGDFTLEMGVFCPPLCP